MGQKKKVKLEDIADRLGVSIVTVSNALKGKKGVSGEMRERITRTAQEMGYQTEKRVQKKKGGYLIGVIVAERYVREFPSFYMEVYKCITQEAMKRGCLTVLEVATEEKENLVQEFAAFQESRISGIILIGELKPDYIQMVRETYKTQPVVCVDYYDICDGMDYIATDSFGGMEQLTRLLIKEGITDLAFVGSVMATKNITDRYLGYCKALDRAGLEDAKMNIIEDRDENGEVYGVDLELPERLPKGFVCNCDRTAFALMKKLKERGIRIPEDVSVVGFDNYPPDVSGEKKLTTYQNDGQMLARLSVRTVIRRIEGRRKAEGIRIVEGSIVKGETVRFKKEAAGCLR